jgi:multidrug transporter EmrE-like cation transporter
VGAVYAALPASVFVAPLAFGAGWGIAQVLFGLSIARLGMALGYAIIVGLGALLGTLVPLFVKNSRGRRHRTRSTDSLRYRDHGAGHRGLGARRQGT